jgi:hypothetical protein
METINSIVKTIHDFATSIAAMAYLPEPMAKFPSRFSGERMRGGWISSLRNEIATK